MKLKINCFEHRFQLSFIDGAPAVRNKRNSGSGVTVSLSVWVQILAAAPGSRCLPCSCPWLLLTTGNNSAPCTKTINQRSNTGTRRQLFFLTLCNVNPHREERKHCSPLSPDLNTAQHVLQTLYSARHVS